MISRSAWLALSLTIVGLVAPGLASAGDASQGAKLAYTCHGCHGIPNYKNVYPMYKVPRLGGQHAAYMVVALQAYASERACALDDALPRRDDVRAGHAGHRRHLAGQELKPTGTRGRHGAQGRQTCVACHGIDGIGILPEYPNLAGQHADYIEVALKAYRSGQRKNAVMGGMAAALTDQDIRELAKYYSSQRPSLCSTNETREGSARASDPGRRHELEGRVPGLLVLTPDSRYGPPSPAAR